ncbi:13938_t:CDS:2, partial [Racocetra fulgida]
DVDKSLVKDQLNEDIDELQIESLSDLKDDIKRLVESFNCYLEKDQINAKNLDIDSLNIHKFLNQVTEQH